MEEDFPQVVSRAQKEKIKRGKRKQHVALLKNRLSIAKNGGGKVGLIKLIEGKTLMEVLSELRARR